MLLFDELIRIVASVSFKEGKVSNIVAKNFEYKWLRDAWPNRWNISSIYREKRIDRILSNERKFSMKFVINL